MSTQGFAQSFGELSSLEMTLDRADLSSEANFEVVPATSGSTSSASDTAAVFVPTNSRRVFRLRHRFFEPSDCLGTLTLDPGVNRTWSFTDWPSRQASWELVEKDQRELQGYFYRPVWRFTGDWWSDNVNFFSRPSMTKFGGIFIVAAVFANTSIDENFRDWLEREELKQPYVDCWYREFGHGTYVLSATAGAFALARISQKFHGDGPVSDALETWSYRTFRSYVVGGPPLLGIQVITGASRPPETPEESIWRPFNDNNGASGHTFVGALPFLVAAKMAKRPLVKASLFAGSGLAGYGRLCDDGHYLSQVMLGWTIAYLSVEATTQTDSSPNIIRLVPLDLHGYYGMGIEVRR